MTTFPVKSCEKIKAAFLILLVPAADRVIVEVKEFANLYTGFTIIQQQDGIRTTRNLDRIVNSVRIFKESEYNLNNSTLGFEKRLRPQKYTPSIWR